MYVLVMSSFFIFQAVAEVVITLIDVNDNYPVFLYQDHKASIPENIANNTFVAVVR